MKSFARSVLSLAVLFALSLPLWSANANAKEAPAFQEPDSAATPAAATDKPVANSNGKPESNSVLADFIRGGVKVYYLGVRDGLNGWFLIRDNQIQIAYSPLDNKNIVFGAMYDGLGSSVTTDQVRALYESNAEVKAFLDKYQNSQDRVGGSPMNGGLPQIGGPQMVTLSPIKPPEQGSIGSLTPPPQMTAQATAAAGGLQGLQQPPPLLPPTEFKPSPGERLMHALASADGVNIGAATAPRIYMVADPNCPHCQKTWQMIRDSVLGGKIEIRIVPISVLDNSEDKRAAAQLLRTANPLDAWDKYIVNGDTKQLAGTPDNTALNAITKNHELVEAWHIQQTPFIIYRSKQGEVKVVQGEPQDANALINDIGL